MKTFSILLLSIIVVIIIVGAYFVLNNNNQQATIINQSTESPTASPQTSIAPSKVNITIQNFAFNPATVTISAGSTVTWVNQDGVPHNIINDASSPMSFNSGVLAQGKGFSYTFTDPGTYSYHCSIHPSMLGKIVVQ